MHTFWLTVRGLRMWDALFMGDGVLLTSAEGIVGIYASTGNLCCNDITANPSEVKQTFLLANFIASHANIITPCISAALSTVVQYN